MEVYALNEVDKVNYWKEIAEYDLETAKVMLDSLEPLNIEARYPTSKEHLIKELTKEKCSNIIQETEEPYKWIRAKL